MGMYLWFTNLHTLHLLERFVKRRRSRLQTILDGIVLLLIELKARLSFYRRMYHHLHQTLPHYRRT